MQYTNLYLRYVVIYTMDVFWCWI